MTSRKRQSKKEVNQQPNEEVSLIARELEKFQKQIEEIQSALESINLMTIEDVEERLKAINAKVMIGLKMPQLLAALDDLKNRAKLKSEDIKGSKDISPLEGGMLD